MLFIVEAYIPVRMPIGDGNGFGHVTRGIQRANVLFRLVAHASVLGDDGCLSPKARRWAFLRI